MIDFLLSSELVPGTNLPADLSSTNWLYLLPRLDGQTTAVLGDVPGELVETLRRLGDRVSVGTPRGPSTSRAREHDFIVVGARWSGPIPPARAVFHLERTLAGAAQLAPDGRAVMGVASLTLPSSALPTSAVDAGFARARRVARRIALRAGAALQVRDRAERTSTLGVMGNGAGPAPAAGTLAVMGADLSALPAYVVDAASMAGLDLRRRPWRVLIDGKYRSQKVVFFVDEAEGSEGLVVKVARDPAFTPRLDNEYDALWVLADSAAGSMAPAARFRGRHAGLSIVGESIVTGSPFSSAAVWRRDDPLAERAVDMLLSLGERPLAGTAEAGEVGASMGSLVQRYVRSYRPADRVRSLLDELVTTIAAQPLPTVLQHGDPGTWNMLVDDGTVRLLDWENAERRGVPTWDVSFFVQAYVLRAAERRGVRPSPRAFARLLLSDTEWSRWHADTLRRAADVVGISRSASGPLFVLGAVYQAVKEIPRLPAHALDRGRAHRVVLECVRAWDGCAMRGLRDA